MPRRPLWIVVLGAPPAVAVITAAAAAVIGWRWAVVIGLGAAALLGWWTVRRLAAPLQQLQQMAAALRQGYFDLPVPSSAVDEVRQLGAALEALGGVLRDSRLRLEVQRQYLDVLFARLAEGVIVLDGDGRVLALNASAASCFGLDDRQAAVGKPLQEVIWHHGLLQLVQQRFPTPPDLAHELTVFGPTTRHVTARLCACPAQQPTDPATIIILDDRTERQRYDQLRKELVANVSHEMKSPLTAIRSLTETLLGGALEDAAHNRRFVGLIDEETTRLGRLIDDLLQLAQLESHEAALQRRAVDVLALVDGLRPAWQHRLERRRLTLTVQLEGLPSVDADPDRLKQVFINLVDNAIKYNREGGTIRITATPDGSLLRIAVEDTGLGIPEPDLPRIFERFYRVDKARSRELGGTGLGLSIVKHIVEAHGGTVAVTSRLDHGSTFTCTLPLQAHDRRHAASSGELTQNLRHPHADPTPTT